MTARKRRLWKMTAEPPLAGSPFPQSPLHTRDWLKCANQRGAIAYGLADPDEILGKLIGPESSVREVALRLLGTDAHVSPVSGALCISRRPRIGSEAYALRVYPGLSDALISSYEQIHDCHIPGLYRSLLQRMNGASLFEISLFGVPPMMARRPPQIDRTTAWPLDIATAQENWRLDYDTSPNDFFIGYGPHSTDEHVGYFLWPNGGVEALRKGGEQFAQWGDFQHFLSDELVRAEAAYPEFEDTMERILRESFGWRSWLWRVTGIKL
jgi:hypothetical protein